MNAFRSNRNVLLGVFVALLFAILYFYCSERELPEIHLELEENGGLFLPQGFKATAVINQLKGKARQIAVRDNGDIFVKLRYPDKKGGNAVLRDTSGDGRIDIIEKFGDYEVHGAYGTGMRIHNDYLYYSSQTTVYRQKLGATDLVPTGPVETIFIDDCPKTSREHIAKPMAFDKEGYMYVPIGAPSNSCQEPKRTPGAPGMYPCLQLDSFASIWKVRADGLNQKRGDGYKYATGIRSLVGLEWNPNDDELYSVMHGRDDLLRLFSNRFSPWEGAMLPSEEFIKITKDSDFGWPYCYYDQINNRKVLAPEYGGDGQVISVCSTFTDPIMGFPGHWAPNDLLFYQGDQYPDRYKEGAFIAFHGSTNRAPYPQSGYFVGFVPFEDGQPTGAWEVFADGFARVDTIVDVSDAVFRPMGLSEGPDGSIYIAETERGAIWKIEYADDKLSFDSTYLVKSELRKELIHLRTPDIIEDNLQKGIEDPGEYTYSMYCGACHQSDGNGDGARFPPLAKTDWVTGDKNRLIDIVLNGLEGDIEVRGDPYNNIMPQHSFLSDDELANVLTFIRTNFGNRASEIQPGEVAAHRVKTSEESI